MPDWFIHALWIIAIVFIAILTVFIAAAILIVLSIIVAKWSEENDA